LWRVQERTLVQIDIAIAAVVVVVGVVEFVLEDIQPAGVAIPMAIIAGSSLAFRRRWPLVVVSICFAALAIDTWAGVPLSQPATPMTWIVLSQYTAARHCTLKGAIAGLAIGLGIFATTLAKDASDLVFGLIIILAPWLVGLAMRSRVADSIELAARADTLERTRDEQVQVATTEERRRIARDLHDVIAHSISVMVVQAGAAAEIVDRNPERASQALRDVQDTGRSALTEMSTLLGVLRESGEEIGLAPQPGLADVESLLNQTRAAGLPVQLKIEGQRRELPAGIELSLYRVIQEALTNARKHAGEASACVTIAFEPRVVRFAITDDGAGSDDGYGGSQGIIGMRERVTIYQGTLEAGPRPGGGFEVRGCIPLATL
jgi:signal transduction histidine kinase